MRCVWQLAWRQSSCVSLGLTHAIALAVPGSSVEMCRVTGWTNVRRAEMLPRPAVSLGGCAVCWGGMVCSSAAQ